MIDCFFRTQKAKPLGTGKMAFLLSLWLSSQNFHKKISTQLLTLLIIRAIVQLEQKRGVQREQKEQKS